MKILVTGGCGFIGSHFVRMFCARAQIVVFDALTYAGNLESLQDVEGKFRFVKGDVADEPAVEAVVAGGFDAIVNFAAESHVDRSLYGPMAFVRSNVQGTLVLLEAARKHEVPRFVQISTDEVYGSLPPEGVFTESTPLAPNSPYSASKAGADLLCRAHHHTFGFPVVITRSSNNYGAYQYPEKFIPLFVTNALEGKECPLYGDGMNVRDWLHVEDNCRAIWAVLERGRPGEVYNIGGGNERPNLDVAKAMLKLVGRPESLIRFVKDRPGHDRRYAIDCAKVQDELGWKPEIPFEEGLRQTVEWYRTNRAWVDRVRSGEYRKFYEMHYGGR
ncbi:MAG: dTDP-glucose 4,6-dehydratase [Planctomycetes bacterium]|nr:dTDP-glucose 4,6-dehydratase [Planctomycetota bacterium]